MGDRAPGRRPGPPGAARRAPAAGRAAAARLAGSGLAVEARELDVTRPDHAAALAREIQVNVSSEGGSRAGIGAGLPAHHVTKAALNARTRTLAAELKPDNILVNAVCPGWTATDMGGPGGRPVTDGAAAVLWAVDLPDDGPTGTFTRDRRTLPW